jgi:hypothetical protein
MCAEVTGYSILWTGPHHKPKHVSRLQGQQTWVIIQLVTPTNVNWISSQIKTSFKTVGWTDMDAKAAGYSTSCKVDIITNGNTFQKPMLFHNPITVSLLTLCKPQVGMFAQMTVAWVHILLMWSLPLSASEVHISQSIQHSHSNCNGSFMHIVIHHTPWHL